ALPLAEHHVVIVAVTVISITVLAAIIIAPIVIAVTRTARALLFGRRGHVPGHDGFRFDLGFLLSAGRCAGRPGSTAHTGANRCAFAPAHQAPKNRACSCSPANQGGVSLGVGFALEAQRFRCNRVSAPGALDGSELKLENAGSAEPAR